MVIANTGLGLGTEEHPVAVVPDELDGALTTSNFTVLDFEDAKPYYWAVCLKQPFVLEQIRNLQKGSGLAYLSMQTLDNLIVPDLDEEKKAQINNEAKAAVELIHNSRELRRETQGKLNRFLMSGS